MAVSNELPFIGLVRTSSRPRSHRDQNAKDPNHKDQQNANPTQGSWLESVLVRFRSTRKAPGTCRRTEQHRTTFPSYSWEGHSTVLKRKKKKKQIVGGVNPTFLANLAMGVRPNKRHLQTINTALRILMI